ncbi:MAG: DUF4435 domain-containing protein [Nodosilinea sp.]
MVDFSYSTEAKNVLNQFYGVEKILYVEGDDDVPFWECIFDKLSPFSVKVQDVGGKPEAKKYAAEIISGSADYLVAMDADYDKLFSQENHPNIIYTYGHSIENSMVTEATLTKLLQHTSKLPRRLIPEFLPEKWLSEISEVVKPLVLYDIASREDEIGCSVMPDNCDMFFKTRKSCDLCRDKIFCYIDDLLIEFDSERLLKISLILSEIGLSILDMINGHFLKSATLRFLKSTVESLKSSISISNDMLFASLMIAFESLFDDTHPHYIYYKNKITSIV